jgi:PilZ domain
MGVIPMMPIPMLNAPTELRCAVRFPLHLAVQLVAGDRQYAAVTENISANGILFHLGGPFPAHLQAEFALRMPASALGAASDVMMYGVGKIIRRYSASGKFHAAVVIDEYRLQRLTGPGRCSQWLM